MDCFSDFCVYCDRDSPDGPYCSQRCKLADHERSNPSSPTSPTSSGPERLWSSTQYSQQRLPSYDPPSSTTSRPRSGYFMYTSQQTIDERQLTPSSSRTSLSSTTTSSSQASGAFSKDAKAQLNDYFSSFDQAKAAKRRSSLR